MNESIDVVQRVRFDPVRLWIGNKLTHDKVFKNEGGRHMNEERKALNDQLWIENYSFVSSYACWLILSKVLLAGCRGFFLIMENLWPFYLIWLPNFTELVVVARTRSVAFIPCTNWAKNTTYSFNKLTVFKWIVFVAY